MFCSDGAVPIDNNVSEREMKRVVLNRKNSLFVANPRGGRTAAILASLTSTCRRHQVDPQLYLTRAIALVSMCLLAPDGDLQHDRAGEQWQRIRDLIAAAPGLRKDVSQLRSIVGPLDATKLLERFSL